MAEMDGKTLQMLVALAKQKTPVKLVNAYKSYPVSHEAAILSLSKSGLVRVQTHKHQILCLYREQNTTLIGQAFPGYIKAHVENLDLVHLTADLGRFQYSPEPFTARETARVTPRDVIPVWVTIKETGFRIRCELSDISLEGLAFLLPVEYYVPNRFRRGAEVLVTFELPAIGSGQPTEVRGQGAIRNTMGAAGLQKKRIGVRLRYQNPQNFVVSQFIQMRIQELLREMDMSFVGLTRLSRNDPS